MEEKRRIIAAALVRGAPTARVARECGGNANRVFQWRHEYKNSIDWALKQPRAKLSAKSFKRTPELVSGTCIRADCDHFLHCLRRYVIAQCNVMTLRNATITCGEGGTDLAGDEGIFPPMTARQEHHLERRQFLAAEGPMAQGKVGGDTTTTSRYCLVNQVHSACFIVCLRRGRLASK